VARGGEKKRYSKDAVSIVGGSFCISEARERMSGGVEGRRDPLSEGKNHSLLSRVIPGRGRGKGENCF